MSAAAAGHPNADRAFAPGGRDRQRIPPAELTPEVLHAVRVDVTFHVLHGMIHNLMNVFAVQPFIRFRGIRESFSAGFDVLFYAVLERLLLPALDNRCSDRAATFHDANHHRLVLATSPGDLACSDVLVHVRGLLAGTFYFAGKRNFLLCLDIGPDGNTPPESAVIS